MNSKDEKYATVVDMDRIKTNSAEAQSFYVGFSQTFIYRKPHLLCTIIARRSMNVIAHLSSRALDCAKSLQPLTLKGGNIHPCDHTRKASLCVEMLK